MGFPPESQNMGLCIALAACGGALEVFATVVVAIPDAREKQGILVTKATCTRAFVINVFFQIMASVLGNTISTWFGPVSIVGPVFFASQMVTNMIVFGFLTGLETFTKDMRVGTWVVVVGTVLIVVNGPQTQEDQDVNELMSHWYSILWSAVLLGGMAITSFFMADMKLRPHRYKSEFKRATILLVARGCALSVNFTVSKPFAMKPGFPMIMLWLSMKILSGAVYSIAIIIQSTAVTQSTFVPMNTTVTLLINAITGIIIWEDWRTVVSWLGYAAAFTLLVLGIYLLLGDVDFQLLTSENPIYGQGGKLEKMRAKRDLVQDLSSKDINASDSQSVGKGADERQDVKHACDATAEGRFKGELEEGGKEVALWDYVTPADEPKPKPQLEIKKSARPGFEARPRHNAESEREAWASLFGAGDEFISRRGGPKQQSIFFNRVEKYADV